MKKNLQRKINQSPNDPGVYQFFNFKDDIIYIGKAKNIRNRIKTYFQNSNKQSSKNIMMVKNIKDLDWIVVRNEVEALMTEANLIKKHQPRYNVDLRDDKSYPFIRITNEPYPQVFLTRKVIRDGSKYFGPFTDSHRLRMILKALNKIFPIRSCSYFIDKHVIDEKKIALCLDYHIKKCEGPCEGLVTEKKYLTMVDRIEDFLRGNTKLTESYLKDRMESSSKSQKYEEAAMYRDQLIAVESFKKNQSHVATDFTERDVIAIVKEGNLGVAVVLRIRNGKIFSRDKLLLKQLNDDSVTMKTIITRFYMNSDFLPNEISLQFPPADEFDLVQWLKQRKNGPIKFIYPKRGEKSKELRITIQNAKLLLGEWLIDRQKRRERIPKILNQLKDDLNLDVPPRIIEAFDVSHLGGINTVASMVSFIDGRPKKSKYRKYSIKTVDGIDDFSSIREVIFRRYKRVKEENQVVPNLILVDGGKGQLSMALSALRELGMDYIPIIGLAKRLEEVFITGNAQPQTIHKTSPSLILLRRIRDEAHRFAIKFQRQKRNKEFIHSIFQNIKGVGKKRQEILLKAFDGPKQIAKLTPEVIRAETGIPIKLVKRIIEKSKNL